MKFAIQHSERGYHEAQTVAWYCSLNKLEYRVFADDETPDSSWIPVGTVAWTERILTSQHITPNHYPPFLRHLLYRKVWRAKECPVERCFIKPADQYKRFAAFVKEEGITIEPRGPYWCSEVVTFGYESRMYVIKGKVVAHYFSNDDLVIGGENPVTPVIKWPHWFCGAVDIGHMWKDDETVAYSTCALVENHHPFACGWYGKTNEGKVYCEWLDMGWYGYMKQLYRSPGCEQPM